MAAGSTALLLLSAVAGLLTLTAAQPMVNIEFAEIDFQEVENEGKINVTLSVMGTTSIPLVLVITPFTFDEYTMQFGRPLPDEIDTRSAGIDRAEFDSSLGGRRDFPQMVQEITVPASQNLRDDFTASIPITNDGINEALEGFLILVETSEATSINTEAPVIIYRNDGLTIGLIVDDDEISFSFEQPAYTVRESDGRLPDTVRVIKDIETELDYTFTVSLRVGGIPAATPGVDFLFPQDIIINFFSTNVSVPVPIETLTDELVERSEDFRLALISSEQNPSTNVAIGPHIDTQVVILDEGVLKIGFTEDNYIVTEGDGVVSVCATFLTPAELVDAPMAVVVFAIYTIEGTALNPDDYVGRTRDEAVANPVREFLTPLMTEVCINITINDDLLDREGSEQFSLGLEFSLDNTNVAVMGCPANVTIQDRLPAPDLDDSVIADPQLTVALPDASGSLCYEVHGDANKFFNLISDTCTSVNAYYTAMPLDSSRNRISNIGIRASSGGPEGCVEIEIDHEDCRATVGGREVNNSVHISEVRVEKQVGNRWRVFVPNCGRPGLVMWVTCTSNRLRFDVTRGSNLRPSSHGLLGQFWNVPITVSDTDGVPRVQVYEAGHESYRNFPAVFYPLVWDRSATGCYYAGDSQGGPKTSHNPINSVIEGHYSHYTMDGLFDTEFRYGQFEDSSC